MWIARKSSISENKRFSSRCERLTKSQIYQDSADERNEMWRQELQDIEERRYELVLEHQKTEKLSQKLQQSSQDKKLKCKKYMGDRAKRHEQLRITIEKTQAEWEDSGQNKRTWNSEACRAVHRRQKGATSIQS